MFICLISFLCLTAISWRIQRIHFPYCRLFIKKIVSTRSIKIFPIFDVCEVRSIQHCWVIQTLFLVMVMRYCNRLCILFLILCLWESVDILCFKFCFLLSDGKCVSDIDCLFCTAMCRNVIELDHVWCLVILMIPQLLQSPVIIRTISLIVYLSLWLIQATARSSP